MDTELRIAVELFIDLVTYLREERRPPMGDSFEERLFWHTPATERYRSACQGVTRVEVLSDGTRFDRILWQSLLEHHDLVVERQAVRLGVECKSLQASPQFVETGSGAPCCTTIDFNSTRDHQKCRRWMSYSQPALS